MSKWLLKLGMIGGAIVSVAGQAQSLPLPPKAQTYVGIAAGIGAILAGLAHPSPTHAAQ